MSSIRMPSSDELPGVPSQRFAQRASDVSPSEPAMMFVLKSLLYPVISVLTLVACLAVEARPPHEPYLVVAVLSFLGVGELLDVVPTRFRPRGLMVLRSLIDITLRWALLMAFLFLVIHVSGLIDSVSMPMLIAWACITPFAFWAGDLLVQRYLRAPPSATGTRRKVLIVGATSVGMQLERNLRERSIGRVDVVGFAEDRQPERISPPCNGRILGALRDVGECVSRLCVDTVYITLPMVPQPRIIELLSSLRDSTASVYFVPDLNVFELMQPRFDLVDGIPVIAVCETPHYGVRTVAKRLSDIAISGSAILALSPVFAVVALSVRVSSPGAVIYRQRRYGLDGREIVVYKFRSLRVVEDGVASYTQVARDDARLTRVGAFIRKTSLDELPQLFNVLIGDMSMVGPRPHAIAVNEQYRRLIPGYMVRHKVKPGITGWAQVNGFRGGDDLNSMTMRIRHDLEYLRHWSLGLDLIIILKTVAIIWKDRHAY